MSDQNYQVSYTINVEATESTKKVKAFADSMSALLIATTKLPSSVTNIKNTMDNIDNAFRKGGRKKDYSYKFNIDTSSTEEKLTRVKTLLTEIGELTKGLKVVINTGGPLKSNTAKAKAKMNSNKMLSEEHKAAIDKNAASAVEKMMETQKRITKSIGKVNAALATLEKGREINIQTDVAKQRLGEILSLMTQIKGASKMTLGIGMGSPGKGTPPAQNLTAPPILSPFVSNPQQGYVLPQQVFDKLQEKLIINRALAKQKAEFSKANEASRLATQQSLIEERGKEWDRQRQVRTNEAAEKKTATDAARAIREKARLEQQNAARAIASVQRQQRLIAAGQTDKQKAAINRLQYVRRPTLNSFPMAGMFNAYMAYGTLKSELAEAVEYNNIMTSARSILRVADSDLTTFENRFTKMALYVRQIGVETKFTAVEVGGAVKYLAMAGMGIETINESIRPITNLALIGDNDISQIADLATNIMSGYDIKTGSMGSVADILSSTMSRSNVNIIEMAESYKMSAGYLRMAGVEFSESAAAIGILGNMGVKGTMAGTSLRAMSTRFAKPTKEAQSTLDRLGVKFTEYRDIYGKQVEKLRPLADIFEDLNRQGATMGDMQAIFGKIGGNAAMMFVREYAHLRTLTTQNRTSHGISGELAKVKQENTKGLWDQVTSQFSEAFMKGYDILEPVIKSTLRDFLARFNAPKFAKGLASIGQGIMEILSLLGKVATWITSNFTWIEPLLFTGFVATKLYKLAGALTNVGVAIGFIGKQSAIGGGLQMISSLAGLGGGSKKMSYASKRAAVTALRARGVTGSGVMAKTLASGGVGRVVSALGLFSNQVSVGNGLVGATASIGALGISAVAATAGVTALIGALGWVAYKTWKIKEAKDAVQEEINANKKYEYPSINALNHALSETYKQAVNAKKAMDELTAEKTIEEASGQTIGAFTNAWWKAAWSTGGGSHSVYGMPPVNNTKGYDFQDARQDDIRAAIQTIAKKDAISRRASAFAKMGKARTNIEIGALIQNIPNDFGVKVMKRDPKLWHAENGKIIYDQGVGNLKESDAYKLPHYAGYMNKILVPQITNIAKEYKRIMSSREVAQAYINDRGLSSSFLIKKGFHQDKSGRWVANLPKEGAKEKDLSDALANSQQVHDLVVKMTASLREIWGGSAEIAENIMQKAGFTRSLYSNEPDYADTEPFNANGITFQGGDDDGAGGNYSGTGKLSSSAPKQVIVNITNLLSVSTIQLLKGKEGQQEEIVDLKEQLAQALIDVVHDFDASWNG